MVDLLMEYKIAIDKEVREIEIDTSDTSSHDYVATIKGQKSVKAQITFLRRDNDRLILSIGEKVYSIIDVKRTSSGVSFFANGQRIQAELQNPLRTFGTSTSLAATAKENISSNFPAKIVKVPVKRGDSVKQGETLIILEAMKMEAQIKAPADSTVEEVFVKEGDMVERGRNLVRLKFR